MHLGEQSQVPTQIGNQRAYSHKDNAQQARESLEEIDWNESSWLNDWCLYFQSLGASANQGRLDK